jgi:hypothetical protein
MAGTDTMQIAATLTRVNTLLTRAMRQRRTRHVVVRELIRHPPDPAAAQSIRPDRQGQQSRRYGRVSA